MLLSQLSRHDGKANKPAPSRQDGGGGSEIGWAPADSSPARPLSSHSSCSDSSLLPPSPSPFAPAGRPMVKTRFRTKPPATLPTDVSLATKTLQLVKRSCSVRWLRSEPPARHVKYNNANGEGQQAAVDATIDRADNSKFLEQFRYTIIASQLLSGTSILGHRPVAPSIPRALTGSEHQQFVLSTEGILASILGALAIAVILSWVRGNGSSYVTRKRLAFFLVLLATATFLGQVYMRRQWLRYRREQSLAGMTTFVSNSNDFDSASEATLSLVQEVELVSRGYRM